MGTGHDSGWRGPGASVLTMVLVFLLLLLAGCWAGGVEAKVVAASVMPHGGIALDPTYFNTTNATSLWEAWALHGACQEVGMTIAELKPNLVLLSTPHGVADLSQFMFYLNPEGFGWGDTDNCICPPCCYNVSVAMDANKSLELVHKLQSLGANVSGLAAYGPPAATPEGAEPFPLRWGEVIPLHFLTPSLLSHSQIMVISQPSRRYGNSVSMVPELLALGASLYAYLESLAEKVVVVISADLAHTHLASGPYGYSNASEPFDKACGEWASTLDTAVLLETAAEYVDRALSCGYTGLVMLHGLMQTAGLGSWSPKLFANYHPSYYGMMVASFTRL